MARVCVFFADGFEEIEGLTVVDILRRAGQEVLMTVVNGSGTLWVTGAHGIRIKGDVEIENVDFAQADMLVLPGGMPGTKNLGDCRQLVQQLKEFQDAGKKIGAICAAPSVLGDSGLLNGRKATCYPGFEERLTGAVFTEEKVVTDGNITTSRGAGTAIPFALRLVELLVSPQKADEIRESILYGHKSAGI